MFKTLFATLMLSTSFGTPLIKTTPQKANRDYYIVYGAYTLNDTFNFDNFDEYYYIEFDSSYNIECYIAGTGRFGNDYLCDCVVNYMYLSWGSAGAEFTCNWSTNYGTGTGGTYDFAYAVDESDFDIDYLASYGLDGRTFPSDYDFPRWKSSQFLIQNFVIYFDNSVVLSPSQYKMFSAFFNGVGNRYTSYYNGWYHYNMGAFYQTTKVYYMQYGLYIVDNILSRGVIHEEDYGAYGNVTNGIDFYDNGSYPNRLGNMQINAMLPHFVRQTMENEGVFAYVQPPVEDYSFAEFFFSIIDAPLYYLTSMFNVEIFGLNMFMAFTSMITLAIIVIVLKKVI